MKKSKKTFILFGTAIFLFSGISGIKIIEKLNIGTPVYVSSANQATLTFEQLRNVATQIIPGVITSQKYDYEDGIRVIDFEIRDVIGRKRELTLVASTGKVYEIDYEIDEQGNRYINQGLFDVKVSYEEAQQIALKTVSGTIVTHKQDSKKGYFVYEFIINGTDSLMYKVVVETTNGTILTVQHEKDFNIDKYHSWVVNSESADINVTPNITPIVPQTEVNTQNFKSEEELRSIVLQQVPGVVKEFDMDFNHGIPEYKYKILTNYGQKIKVTINGFGYIEKIG